MIFSLAAAEEVITVSVNLSMLARTASMSGKPLSSSSADNGPSFGGVMTSQPALRRSCSADAPTWFIVRAVIRTFQDMAAECNAFARMRKRGVTQWRSAAVRELQSQRAHECISRLRLVGLRAFFPLSPRGTSGERAGERETDEKRPPLPRPSPPFLGRRGRREALLRSRQTTYRTQLVCDVCDPQSVAVFKAKIALSAEVQNRK